ncbi:zona pellucida-binding protein 2 isoform X10 [Rattus norvegicus]|uniref:zona pellucida-binding protein 2 isoform X10 n=1 Tax=Rattus norvegicus TaxID=10116 RepID=UPI001916E97D|nr:zona pellucida-binding protein 2 isoform X5 [Rattus norvegicus]
MLAWALLSAVLWSLAGVGSARSSLFSNEGFVYGTVGHPVKIYVKLHQTSPVLVCMDIDRASKETVDPIYLWIGPNENTLTVNPFAPGWKSMCNSSMDCEDVTNHNILKARDRIEEFFRSQAYILHHHFNITVPAMHFVDHSFQVTRIDNCRPGFGKNEGLHSNCASCCVVCSPGTFSPDMDVTCQTCVSAHVYGAKACP